MVHVVEGGAELRWTADGQSATEASAIAWRLGIATQSLKTGWLLMTTFTAIFTWSAHRAGAVDPWEYGLTHAAAGAIIATILFAVLGFLQLVRANKKRLRPGTELTATWQDHSVLFVSRLAEVRIPLSTIKAIRTYAFWVAVQQSDTRVWLIWPRELFPDTVLARLPVVGTEPAAG
jgi:hypothetical protein